MLSISAKHFKMTDRCYRLAFVTAPATFLTKRANSSVLRTSCFTPFRHVDISLRPKTSSSQVRMSSTSTPPASSSSSDFESSSEPPFKYNEVTPDIKALSSDTVITDADLDDVRDTDFEERKRREEYLSDASTGIPIPPKPTVVEIPFTENRTMRLETGRLARQAAGAVLARMGDTIVFCTACADSSVSPTVDFLPLRVDYAEKFSATGRTSGSYAKREGRPSEREVLVSRLIDRSLRPMFATGYFNEVQVLANVFSYDQHSPADALAICGASAALHISHIPLAEPIAGVRLAILDDTSDNKDENSNDGTKRGMRFVVEPSADDMKNAKSELVVAGTRSGILMIEGYCDFLSDDEIMEGVRTAHDAIKRICDGIDQLREQTGSKPKVMDSVRTVPPELSKEMAELSHGLDEALALVGKKERDQVVYGLRDRVFESLKSSRQQSIEDRDGLIEHQTLLKLAWKELVSERMRRRIIDTGIRPDGRDCFTVRPITIDRAPLPGAHGSALFTRGETQALAVATLGGSDMAQRSETLDGEQSSRFYLQYSFPPFSVGEVGWLGPPGRREIGHGKLAERSLMASIPDEEDFPYVLRVESNILESNGSSSMASVCGGCLALLEAGVPLKCSVAGVAMGLVVDKAVMNPSSAPDGEWFDQNSVILTDILGLEDALGSCDAKFAGSRQGWSALQLDVKLRGIPLSLFERLLKQAAVGRDHVLDEMDQVMPKPNSELPSNLPKVVVMSIPVKRVGEFIGPGGKNIRSIIERCGGDDVIRISVGSDDGQISLSSADESALNTARAIITAYQTSVEIGSVVTGKVTKLLQFGAHVEIAPGIDAWLHISDMENKRTATVQDVCKVGDAMEVKVTEVGRNGQIRVSRKALLPKWPSSNTSGHNSSPTRRQREKSGAISSSHQSQIEMDSTEDKVEE